MRFSHWFLFFATFSVCFAVAPASKPVAKKGPSTSSTKKKAPVTKSAQTSAKAHTGKTVAQNRTKGKGPARPPVARSQSAPTPERYKEIQEALASRGYLKSEANGKWDTQSADALRQFQTDRGLTPTGKLSAASLIGLGLGPKNSAAPIVPPVPSKEPGIPPAELPKVDVVPDQP
jgi:hypothetical protein